MAIMREYSALHENSVVSYKLTPKDRPIHPDKLWTGKVIRYCDREYLLEELLTPGYEGCREYIQPVEKPFHKTHQ
jgi:hypothetical protein